MINCVNKWGVRVKPPMQKIPSNLWRYPTLREENVTPHSLRCGLHMVTSFQRGQNGKAGKRVSKFTVEKPEKSCLS